MELMQPSHEILPCLGGPLAGLELPVVLAPGQRWVAVNAGGAVRFYLIERMHGIPHHLTFVDQVRRARRPPGGGAAA